MNLIVLKYKSYFNKLPCKFTGVSGIVSKVDLKPQHLVPSVFILSNARTTK